MTIPEITAEIDRRTEKHMADKPGSSSLNRRREREVGEQIWAKLIRKMK